MAIKKPIKINPDIQSVTLRVKKAWVTEIDEFISKHPEFKTRNSMIETAIIEFMKSREEING